MERSMEGPQGGVPQQGCVRPGSYARAGRHTRCRSPCGGVGSHGVPRGVRTAGRDRTHRVPVAAPLVVPLVAAPLVAPQAVVQDCGARQPRVSSRAHPVLRGHGLWVGSHGVPRGARTETTVTVALLEIDLAEEEGAPQDEPGTRTAPCRRAGLELSPIPRSQRE